MAETQYHDIETDHEYDGIREFDNKLPNWWLATLWGAVIFGIAYWAYYHTYEVGPSTLAAFQAEMEAAEQAAEKRAARAAATGTAASENTLTGLAKDNAAVSAGKAAYDANCVACHRADGGGGIGPNLTDSAWLHDGSALGIYKSVNDGIVAKGMPAWKAVLGDTKVQQVTAYLLTLKGTNVADGKAPQGK
jgi:cytochrome c oxidase cbb3-type subunit 3